MRNHTSRVKRLLAVAAIVAISTIAGGFFFDRGVIRLAEGKGGAAQANSDASPLGKYVDPNGSIRLPEDYRLHWTHLGSYYVEGADDGAGTMHDVYAEPEAVEAFQKTGKFPAGATLVKEIRSSRKAKMTTGEAHWDAGIVQWFVLVKDANQPAFPGNPKWGRGWGWALFSIKDPKKDISTDYKTDCLHCHLPAAKSDWIFQHGYPVLHETDGPFKKYPASNYNGNEMTDKPAGD